MTIKREKNIIKVYDKSEKYAVTITNYGIKIIVEYCSVWRCHYEKFHNMKYAWYDAYKVYREELK